MCCFGFGILREPNGQRRIAPVQHLPTQKTKRDQSQQEPYSRAHCAPAAFLFGVAIARVLDPSGRISEVAGALPIQQPIDETAHNAHCDELQWRRAYPYPREHGCGERQSHAQNLAQHTLLQPLDAVPGVVNYTVTPFGPKIVKKWSTPGTSTVLTIPARLKRTDMSNTLEIYGKPNITGKSDHSLLRLIALAQRLNDLVTSIYGKPVQDLAAKAGLSRSYFTRVFRLTLEGANRHVLASFFMCRAHHWNLRFLKAATSCGVSLNHSPLARRSAKRRCQ